MTAPSQGLLDFFALEAAEYVERLDALLAGAATHGPDVEDFARTSRALRGSATMARVQTITEIAHSLERVARALREGSARWDSALAGVLVSAVDGVKILLHELRTPSPDHEMRTRQLVASL